MPTNLSLDLGPMELPKRIVCLSCLGECLVDRTLETEDLFAGDTEITLGDEGDTCVVCECGC